VQNVVRSAKFATIDELLAMIRAIGRRLVDANPKGEYQAVWVRSRALESASPSRLESAKPLLDHSHAP
jgi:hypothetical protein